MRRKSAARLWPSRTAIPITARTLQALRGSPRNAVPSTVVSDRSHRVAAVLLTTLRVSELLPVVERIAAEPADAQGTPVPPTPIPTP